MSDLKPIDLSNVASERKKLVNPRSPEYRLELEGVFGDRRIEPAPERINTPCEVVYSGRGNQYITLGRDRPGRRDQGYSGSGDTHANSIDICVGMQSYDAKDDTFVDPDFKKDAARIYISQKTDVDRNFRLNGRDAQATSAVAMFADNIRVAARENVKIVSGVGKRNSRGIPTGASRFGVDIIANNNAAALQPLVKGGNLKDAMIGMVSHLHDIYGVIERILNEQDRLNKAVTYHQHFSPFFGMTTSPSPDLILYGLQTMWHHFMYSKFDIRVANGKLVSYQNNYLKHGGKHYINSYYNRVN